MRLLWFVNFERAKFFQFCEKNQLYVFVQYHLLLNFHLGILLLVFFLILNWSKFNFFWQCIPLPPVNRANFVPVFFELIFSLFVLLNLISSDLRFFHFLASEFTLLVSVLLLGVRCNPICL